jgi:hypothetical protein
VVEPRGIDVNVIAEAVDASDVQRLATAAERAGVLRLWVTARASRGGDPEVHDNALASAAAESSVIDALPVLVPPTGLRREYARSLELIADSPYRVVRFCPLAHGYPLLDWILEPLPELCARYGVAMLLDFEGGSVPWGPVSDFAREFPSVPVVVVGADVVRDRSVPAVLDRTSNVVVTLASEGATDLIEAFGAHRFVWSAGSSEPLAPPPDLPEPVAGENAAALAAGRYARAHL